MSEPNLDSASRPQDAAPLKPPVVRLPFFTRLRHGFHFPKSWKEVKALGWKAILAFVIFYLIRDLILYVLIPYLVYRGMTK